MPLALDLVCASSRDLLHASSAQPGYTSEVKTMFLPSGDQMAPSASVDMLVIFLGDPVAVPAAESKSLTQTCEEPSRALTKRNFLPSGDQCPPVSPAGSEDSWRASPPASATIHRCVVFLFSFKSTSMAEKRTHLPSGETAGLPTRLSDIMSAKVKGRLAGAAAWAET